MLKVYKYYAYVSVDGAEWRRVDDGHTIREEEPTDTLILDNATFDETYEYLSKHIVWGLYNDTTFFIKKPVVQVSYSDAWSPVEYKYFKTLSYKRVYKEWNDVPLQWLIEHASADQFIQYLKERGITTCPMNF